MSSVRSIDRLWSRGACSHKARRAARLRRARPLLVLLGALTGLVAGWAGCASESKLLRSDPTFTAGALTRGGIAVVSVVKKEEVEQVRPPLIAALEAELARGRPDLRLIPANRVADALGLPAYRRLLTAYQGSGSLDASAVHALAGAVGAEARFAVLGRVLSDVVRSSERGISPDDPSRYRLFNTALITGRDARVEMRIYDLTNGAMVYRAQYAGSAEDSRPARFGVEGGGTVGGGTTIGVGSRDPARQGVPDSLAEDWGRYPDAPTLASALTEAFRTFTADLPK